jgi:hypothetical protein
MPAPEVGDAEDDTEIFTTRGQTSWDVGKLALLVERLMDAVLWGDRDHEAANKFLDTDPRLSDHLYDQSWIRDRFRRASFAQA